MLAAALEDEVAAYIAAHGPSGTRGAAAGGAQGHARPRQVTTVAGAIEVTGRVNDKRTEATASGRGSPRRSCRVVRKSRRSPRCCPPYLHGLSSKDFVRRWSSSLARERGCRRGDYRLTEAWQEEYRRWCEKDLSGADYVYCWADGLHFGVRLDQDRVCTLVVIGVRADGKKELVALADGHRESTESWAGLLRDARRRGMRAPVLAVGDGALGFWAALAEVFPRPAWPLLAAQGGQRPRLPAEIGPARGPQGAGADPRRRRPRARREGDQGFRRRLPGQVPQGRRQDHR